ncbi:hypothetical protein WJX72_009300 [[Myrmecia] bisecta]|uniref:non-specific serine/threonine protein kinase n=1 Tax=[Myrmecia] bisecta TaxID=41462 RepID=A0AAW1PLX9_9CHLO
MDKYIKGKLLGKGSYGAAFLVSSKLDGKKYVIKEIDVSRLPRKEREAAEQEAKVLLALNHPNVVSCKESFVEGGKLLIVMDYCSEGDLYAALQKRRGVPLPEGMILDWFVQICLGLKHVHDRKILHRDLKTQNVFMSSGGLLKLGDFGVSKVLNSTYQLAGTAVGTPYYLSPEICQNRSYNAKTDIWSLGCILYEMITFRHPFEGASMRQLISKIIKGSYLPISAGYSRGMRELVDSMLQVDSSRRPTANDLLKSPIVKARIEKFLSETVRADEFSHTVMHNKAALQKAPAAAAGVRITASAGLPAPRAVIGLPSAGAARPAPGAAAAIPTRNAPSRAASPSPEPGRLPAQAAPGPGIKRAVNAAAGARNAVAAPSPAARAAGVAAAAALPARAALPSRSPGPAPAPTKLVAASPAAAKFNPRTAAPVAASPTSRPVANRRPPQQLSPQPSPKPSRKPSPEPSPLPSPRPGLESPNRDGVEARKAAAAAAIDAARAQEAHRQRALNAQQAQREVERMRLEEEHRRLEQDQRQAADGRRLAELREQRRQQEDAEAKKQRKAAADRKAVEDRAKSKVEQEMAKVRAERQQKELERQASRDAMRLHKQEWANKQKEAFRNAPAEVAASPPAASPRNAPSRAPYVLKSSPAIALAANAPRKQSRPEWQDVVPEADARRAAYEEMRAAAERNKRAVREQDNRLADMFGPRASPASPDRADKPSGQKPPSGAALSAEDRRQVYEELRAAAERNKRAVLEQENRLAGAFGVGPSAAPSHTPDRLSPREAESASAEAPDARQKQPQAGPTAEERRQVWEEMRAAAERNRRQVRGDGQPSPIHSVQTSPIASAQPSPRGSRPPSTQASPRSQAVSEDGAASEAEYAAMVHELEDVCMEPPSNDADELDQAQAGKFLLEGQEVDIGVAPTDSAAHKVEALRAWLERRLGTDLFLKVYRKIESLSQDEDEAAVAAQLLGLLGADKMPYLQLVHQLIICEELAHAE